MTYQCRINFNTRQPYIVECFSYIYYYPERGFLSFNLVKFLTMERPKKGIVVDGSTRGNPGPSKYKLVDLSNNKVLFESDWIGITTNNITEFLALCHAVYYVEKHKLDTVIYSDSQTALAWIKKKKANSGCKNLQERVNKAQVYLKSRPQMPIIEKWHTAMWGENPADFGNKK